VNISYWEQNAWFDEIDVLIIGSGIVGLNAALHLKTKSPRLKVLILERGMLPSGASTKNAGFACFGSPSELLDDLAKMKILSFHLSKKDGRDYSDCERIWAIRQFRMKAWAAMKFLMMIADSKPANQNLHI
jgi:glycine/D-amino acid oxidase-like deaminating enzyme